MILLDILKLKLIVLSIIFSIFVSHQTNAVTKTWTGNVSTEWNNYENWNLYIIPNAMDDIIIPTSPTGRRMPIIDSGTVSIKKLTIESGATLTQNGGTLTSTDVITILGSFLQNTGTFTTTKKLTVAASGLFSISGSFSGVDVDVLSTATLNVNGNFTTNSKKITIDAATFNQTSGTVVTRDMELKNVSTYNQFSSELKIEHDLKVSAGNTFNGISGIVRFIDVAGAGADYSGNIQFYNLVIDSLADYKMSNSSETIKISGNFTNNNIALSQGKGKIIFNGYSDQYIFSASSSGSETFEDLEINNTAGVIYLASNIEVSNNVTVTNGILDIETFDLQSSSAAGILTLDNDSELRIGGSYPTNFGTENFAEETVINYNGTSDQTVRYGFIRRNLRLEGSGTKTSDGDISVSGDVYIAHGVTFNTDGHLITVEGSIHNEGNFVSTNNTGPMSFYSKQSGELSSPETWSNTGHFGAAATRVPGTVNSDILIVGNEHTVTLTSDANNLGTVRVESNGKMILGDHIISGAGEFDLRSGGSIVVASPQGVNISGNEGSIQTSVRKFGDLANFEYNGSSPQVTGDGLPQTVSKLIINNSSGVALSKSVNINGNLNLTQGLLSLGENNLTLGSASLISGTPSSSNMVIADGSGQLRKRFLGADSFTFPIGDNSGIDEYSPITLNFTSGTFSDAYVGVNVVNAKHPQNQSTENFIYRYWSVNSNGISDFICGIGCVYSDQDIQGDESNMFAGRYDGSQWFVLNQANSDLNELTGTVSSFSDFTGGESGALTVVNSSVDLSPKSFSLSQNYPNPFNPSTKIRYSIPLLGGDERGGLVTLKVYDILGNEVAMLVNEELSAGVYEVEFDASHLSSGAYICRIQGGTFSDTRKMILSK